MMGFFKNWLNRHHEIKQALNGLVKIGIIIAVVLVCMYFVDQYVYMP